MVVMRARERTSPMFGLGYVHVHEKLHAAVSNLTRDTPLRERLIGAWTGALARLDPRDFPEGEKRDRWKALQMQLDRLEAASDHPSNSTMSDDEVRAIADEIISLYDWVCHKRGASSAF